MQTINPAAHHLFCKRLEAVTTTKSGFYLTEKAAEKPEMAEVINVGSSVMGYEQQDTIIYKPYSTTDIKLGGKEYFLVADEDVLGKVVETDDQS